MFSHFPEIRQESNVEHRHSHWARMQFDSMKIASLFQLISCCSFFRLPFEFDLNESPQTLHRKNWRSRQNKNRRQNTNKLHRNFFFLSLSFYHCCRHRQFNKENFLCLETMNICVICALFCALTDCRFVVFAILFIFLFYFIYFCLFRCCFFLHSLRVGFHIASSVLCDNLNVRRKNI